MTDAGVGVCSQRFSVFLVGPPRPLPIEEKPMASESEVVTLIRVLSRLALDGIKAGADGKLSPEEVVALAVDVMNLGDALRDLAIPNDPDAVARARDARERVKERRAARRASRKAKRVQK